MFRSTEGWISQYQEKGALWIHDGNPKCPHALLTSGKHSNGFFNSELVMEDPMLIDEACFDLVALLTQFGVDIKHSIDRVVGPAMGAITLAHNLALIISLQRESPCFRAYTEKETDGNSKSMVFKKTTICRGERILPVEDVLTTGGSIDLTVSAVTNAGGVVLPFVAVLVNRSGLFEVSGRKIVALIDRPMPMWTPEDCPLCKEGSEAIRPKGTENWARLNASY